MSNYKYKSTKEFLKVADKLTEKEWAALYNEEMKKDPAYGNGVEFNKDCMTRQLNERERVVLEHIWEDMIPPKSLCVDVGCACGRFVKELGDNGYNAIGIEVANDLVNIGNDYFIQENRDEIIMPISVLSFKITTSFKVITCFETLEHILDWKSAINNMINNLCDDGTIYITVPYKNRIGSPYHINIFDECWLDYLDKEKLEIKTEIHNNWLLSIITKIKK